MRAFSKLDLCDKQSESAATKGSTTLHGQDLKAVNGLRGAMEEVKVGLVTGSWTY